MQLKNKPKAKNDVHNFCHTKWLGESWTDYKL